MGLTKLDSYDYMLFPGVIRIMLSGTNDPSLVDIFSEIDNSGGRIYVEGFYFLYLDDYSINATGNTTYIDLRVMKTA